MARGHSLARGESALTRVTPPDPGPLPGAAGQDRVERRGHERLGLRARLLVPSTCRRPGTHPMALGTVYGRLPRPLRRDGVRQEPRPAVGPLPMWWDRWGEDEAT